jgi:serine/threonine protein kinase
LINISEKTGTPILSLRNSHRIRNYPVCPVNSFPTITKSEGLLFGKDGKNTLEVEFVVKKHQIPLTFNVALTRVPGYFKKHSYSFKLTKTDELIETPRMTPVTEDQLKGILKKENEKEKKQEIKIKVKMVVADEIKYDYIDPRDSPETTLDRFKRDYGKIMKYQDKETDYVTLTTKEDMIGFLENVEKDKVPKIYLFDETLHSNLSIKKTISIGTGSNPTTNTTISVGTPSSGSPSTKAITFTWKKGEKLGKGAFGTVYMGFNEDSGKLMAVKEVDLKGVHFTEDRIKALESEIGMLSQLDHPHIVKYQGMEKTKDHLYIMLDYIPGGSIESVLKNFHQLKENVVAKYTGQILKGLDYLHSQSILHRDIKSGNILLDERGTVYLSDFGSAKKFTKELQKKEKFLEGTPNYMPPEVIENAKYTKASDIYALGCTVLEMLTGNPPFHDKLQSFQTPLEFFVWRKDARPKLTIPDTLSENAKSFLQACLQDYPENRKKATELLNHVFISGISNEDFESGGEEENVNVYSTSGSTNQEYVDDGFDFDDIPPPGTEPSLDKKASSSNITDFLKRNAKVIPFQ